MGLVAKPDELRRAVVDEVVGVEAVEEPGGCEADELRAREEVKRSRKLWPQRRPVGRREVARVVDEDVPHAECRDVFDVEQDRRGRAARVRLEVDGNLEVMAPRGGDDARKARVFG